MATRVLIITASVGEGHDLPARTLADQLRVEHPEVEVIVEDGLPSMGRFVAAISEGAPRVVFFRFAWLWDVGFWAFARFGPTRRGSQALLARLASPGLLELVERHRPDVVVSTWPNATEVLGRLRASGRLQAPVVSAITDLAGMDYWASPGVDLHLVTHPESIEEVREVAGADAEVRAVHGLTRPEFVEPRDPGDARRALDLAVQGKVVLVSGGGWGVGDLEGAVEEALATEAEAVVCLCGRNELLRAQMERRFGGDPRFRAEGFTDRMPDWLAAADALVHSTGGLTVLEAHIRGCPVISYGFGRGHVRVNNQAFRRFGIAEVATSAGELRGALGRALASRRPQDLSFAALPSAASIVVALL